jgi:hypothetical protein
VREAHGILQTDVILQSAIAEGLRRLRSGDQKFFEAIFANLRNDRLTRQTYGDKEIARIKEWFCGGDGHAPVNVPVFMNYRRDELRWPCVTIGLMESTEAEQTHGDVHYQHVESVPLSDIDWPPIAGPFAPDQYAPSSGLMVIPPSALGTITPSPGMWLVDAVGAEHLIQDVVDDNVIALDPGTTADFRSCYLKGANPRLTQTIESVNMRETYQITVWASGESIYLTYLHAIVQFLLLHYKQELLEGRGLERTVISSGPFSFDPQFAPEIIFKRTINMVGYVRQIWPKKFVETVEEYDQSIVFVKDDVEPVVTEDDGGEDTGYLVEQ